MPSRPRTLAVRCARLGVLLTLGTVASPGCSTSLWHKAPPVKYETVASSKRRDSKTAKVKHAEALAIIEKGKPEKLFKAENLLNDALVADVRYGPAHNTLGMVYYMQNKLYLAAWEFEYAAKLMPTHPTPLNNLGLVYERAGKYEDAISYYTMALSHDEGNPEILGNLVRAKLDTGEKGQDIKEMIADLALYHPNPAWQAWARDEVALAKFDKSPPGLVDHQPQESGMPESLPTPIEDAKSSSEALPLPTPDILKFPKSITPGETAP